MQSRLKPLSNKVDPAAAQVRRMRLPYINRFSLRTQTRLLLALLSLSLTALFLFLWLGSRI